MQIAAMNPVAVDASGVSEEMKTEKKQSLVKKQSQLANQKTC
jgi:translation elongation factor EF-Ts